MMLITKRCILLVVLCHLTLLLVKGQETTTSAAKLNDNGEKGDGNENTPTVGETTGFTSGGTTTVQSTPAISQTNAETTEQPTRQTVTSTIQSEITGENSTAPSIKLSTSTVEEIVNTTMTVSSESNVNESTKIPSTITDRETHQTSTAVVTDSNTFVNETTVMTNTNKTTDATTTESSSASSSVGYETSSEQSEDSNLNATDKSTVNPPELTSLTTNTEKTTEISSKMATEFTSTVDSSQEVNTGVAGIVSPIQLTCKNYTVNVFKPGRASLPCTIHTTIDIDCNETALIWGENNKNKVTCGNVNYGVALNITDNGAHNYTSDITFFDEAKLDKEVTMTIKIVLVNKLEKTANFTIKFIESPSGTAVNKVNVFSCLISIFLLIVYLF